MSSGERLGKKLRQRRGMPPITFVDKPTIHRYEDESISSYSEKSEKSGGGGGGDSEHKKSSSEGFGAKTKALFVLAAFISTAIVVYQKKKPENPEQDADGDAEAKKWAVSAGVGVAAIVAYLLFFSQ